MTFERPDARHTLLVVEGEIDTLTAGALERALSGLLAEPAEVLVVDLTAVTFLASSGLAVLIRTANEAGERRLRLVAAARAVRRPMEITGSDQLFDLYPDRAAALSPSD
ncbi:MAG: STAS domain-containing protein [Pseudonocardia sp.]|nr:STAS domain-containing protein [Pseudonocardia sp.]